MKLWQRKNLIQLFCLIIICLFLWFFLTFRITEVPPGINSDEASIGYNAILVSRTLYDENNRFLPIFILTLDKKDWKQPITFYSTVLAFRLFGASYELLREVSIIFVIASFVLLFFLLRELFDYKTTIFGLLIFITTPIVIIQSHLALENIAPIPFIIFWLLMILKYQKTLHIKYLFLAGFILGLSFYSYNAMRIILPILMILTTSYIIFIKSKLGFKKRLITATYFLIGVAPFIIVLPWLKIAYPGAIFGNGRPTDIISYQQLLFPYLSSFDLSFLYFKGDITPFHSTGRQGMFLLATLPVFLLGCFKALQSKKPFLVFVLLAFFLSPILFGWVGSIYRASRLLVWLPFYVIIATLGFSYFFELKKKILRYVFATLIIILICINLYNFINDYWFDYPVRIKENFSETAHLGFKNLYEQSSKLNLKPVVQLDIYQRENVAGQFFEELYFPNSLSIWQRESDIPTRSILLAYPDDLSFSQKRELKKININMLEYTLWETK